MHSHQPKSQHCTQMDKPYAAAARLAAEVLEAAKQAAIHESFIAEVRADRRHQAAIKQAKANFETRQKEINDRYSKATEPHREALHRARISADLTQSNAIAQLRAKFGIPEHASIAHSRNRDLFENELDDIFAISKAANEKADQTYQLAFGPINIQYKLSSMDNKIAFEAGERVAHWEHKCDLHEAKQLCEQKEQLATDLYRHKRQSRLALWKQYQDGNEQAIEEIKSLGMP